jgi:hypothetical protein
VWPLIVLRPSSFVLIVLRPDRPSSFVLRPGVLALHKKLYILQLYLSFILEKGLTVWYILTMNEGKQALPYSKGTSHDP